MMIVLLISHIAAAMVTIGYTGAVALRAFKRDVTKSQKLVKPMWCGAIVTISSGIGLIISSPQPIGRSCIGLLSFVVVVSLAQIYEIKIARSERKSALT